MTTSNIYSKRTNVKIGNYEFEGLYSETGEFGIAVQQIVTLFQIRHDNAQRDIKTALGKGSKFVKWCIIGGYTKKPNNVCSLEQFVELIKKYHEKGNVHATKILTSLIGVSLTQLFSRAFKQEFNEEQFQEKLIEWQEKRYESKDLYWDLRQAILAWYGDNAANTSGTIEQHRMSCFKAISVGLFGKQPCQIANELGINTNNFDMIRDGMGIESLRRINHIQTLAAIRIQNGDKPHDGVKYALVTFNFSVIDYKN